MANLTAADVLAAMAKDTGPSNQPANDWMPFIRWMSKYAADATWPGLNATQQQVLMQKNLESAQQGMAMSDLYRAQQDKNLGGTNQGNQQPPAATSNAAAFNYQNPQGTKAPKSKIGLVGDVYRALAKVDETTEGEAAPMTSQQVLEGIRAQDIFNNLR